MLTPVKKTRLYEEIVKQILDKIKTGELKPGDRLPTERDLALQLKVSRTAIREALRSMELMGLIDSRVGGGTFIKEMTLEYLMDPFAGVLAKNDRLIIELIEVRLLLEVEIARQAARKITTPQIDELDNTLAMMEKEIAEGGLGLKGDNAFHQALANAADNLAMMSITRLCGELLNSTRKAALEALGDLQIGVRHHRSIFTAVKAGDSEEAGRLMRLHLETAYQNLARTRQNSPS
ncbi:MAG TPA: GntR family transcriptional regulator [Clostridiales bacterium]|nr:GntR family transcriptional regulator [Clostridiales bacterium]